MTWNLDSHPQTCALPFCMCPHVSEYCLLYLDTCQLSPSAMVLYVVSRGISVMEDEGTMADHLSGVAATDGQWHHIAVTWDSASGDAILYDNGRQVWKVRRSKGKEIPSGGTLVIGREQVRADCTHNSTIRAPSTYNSTIRDGTAHSNMFWQGLCT